MSALNEYSKLLADKLDHVPIPHREDAVWATLQARLPFPVNDPLPKQGKITGNKLLYIIIGIITIALVLLVTFILLGKKDDQKKSSKQPNTNLFMVDSTTGSYPQKDSIRIERNINNVQPTYKRERKNTFLIDSMFTMPLRGLHGSTTSLHSDSIKVIPPLILDNIKLSKTKGVSGIDDSAYRILIKKDSSRN